jgi:hypothetical protein
LQADPYELNNIYGQASAEVKEMLDAWLRAMESCAAGSCRSFELAPPEEVLLPLIER